MKPKYVVVLISLLVIFPSTSVLAQSNVQISDAVLTNYKTDIIIRNSKLIINRNYELQINNRAGEEYAEITLPYSKLHKVSKVDAFIKDKNGIIVKKLKSSDIVDRNEIADFSLYEDNFVKEFTLVHNEYPYTICYSYTEQQDAFFFINNWCPVINTEIPTLKASMTLEVPLDYPIAYTSQLIDSFKVDTLEKQIRYSWKTSYLHQFTQEVYAPDKHTFMPNVNIVPLKFKYDKEGEQNTWIAYGNWEYNLMEGLDVLPDAEKSVIDKLVKDLKDDNEKVKTLYHYLQDETRYINVTIATGGMKPYPASYVAVNKYGDCKALTNYMKAVLSYVGIKSLYTDVYAGDEIKKIDRVFPSMQFNHVILCIPLKNDTVWLDCTSDGPYNHLGTFTQNRNVLLIEKDHSHFTKTPSLSVKDVTVTRSIEITTDSLNEVMAYVQSIYKGISYESLFELSHSVSESKKEQIIHNFLNESNYELIDYKFIPANRDSAFISFEYRLKANQLYKKYGNDELIGLIPFYVPSFTTPKIRKYPVQIDFPINKLDTLNYRVPFDYAVSSLPQNQKITSRFGTYSVQSTQKGNSVEVIKRFILYAGNYPIEQYKEFFQFVSTVSESENNSYIVTNKKIK